MIPKKIHYCWFGGKPLSELTLKCIASWEKYLPEYEIIEWNENNYDINQNQFVKEAYQNKKFAFVSDVCRLEILQKHGGVYLDTDMELLQSLNCITDKIILGFEDIKYVAAGLIIAPKNTVFVQNLLDHYQKKSFNKELKEMTIPKIITNELVNQGLILNNNFQIINNMISVYPSEFFYPLNFFTGKLIKTENSLAIHHYDSSWISKKQMRIIKSKVFLIKIFGEKIIEATIKFLKKNDFKKS